MPEELYGSLEFPYEKAQVVRGTKVQGWTFSSSGKEVTVEIHLDGVKVKEIKTGIPRFDVEKKFSEYSDFAYQSGFLTKLAMPKISIYKFHVLEIITKTDNISKSIAKVNVKLNTKIENEAWPDEGMTKNFMQSGKNVFNLMKKNCDLKPFHRVFDLGCQLGRMAIPFSKFLNKNGTYDGLDIIKESIEWCKLHITTKYPNFHFTLADVYNSWYNPVGRYKPFEYKFPYEDRSFDFVIVYSVFTHMLLKEMENYFSQISRVMRKGAQCWLTFAILDEESKRLLKNGSTRVDFKYQFDGYRTQRIDKPESSVAWDEKIIRKICDKNGLKIIEPIYPGSWRGTKNNLLPQDIVILSKN